MPTLQVNKALWDGQYNWKDGGDEWSQSWGSPRAQWFGTIFPRIHSFVPTNTILEIACGYGRWTYFLKDLCNQLIAVDISEECIQACKKRFALEKSMSFYVTNGTSLEMAADNSVDFVFSMDSLVHCDDIVLKAYITELSRILTKNGVAFLHHSNLGDYASFLNITQKLSMGRLLTRLGLMEKSYLLRDENVNAKKIEMYANEFGLKCISQETINWGTKKALIDCLSIITRKESSYSRENHILHNPAFSNEIIRIGSLYSFKQLDNNV